MPIANSLVADAERIREMPEGVRVLDLLESRFSTLGATHFLVTGVPLPGRAIEPLILRINWGDLHGEKLNAGAINPDDPVLRHAFRHRRAFAWNAAEELAGEDSALDRLTGPRGGVRFVTVPICGFLPYQGCVVAAGAKLDPDSRILLFIDNLCSAAFRRLFALGEVQRDRPGALSARERKVVELSATGKTASEIAGLLDISQRTVHAHLQNASEKLHASNKTHTVVEALRYGQITV